MGAPFWKEKGNVLITASKMDGVCDCGTSSKGNLAKVQPPSEPGLRPWMCVFSWLSVGRGGGLRHVKEEEHFPVLAICCPGPVRTTRQPPSLAAWDCEHDPGFSGPNSVLCEWGSVGVKSKIVNLDRLQSPWTSQNYTQNENVLLDSFQ